MIPAARRSAGEVRERNDAAREEARASEFTAGGDAVAAGNEAPAPLVSDTFRPFRPAWWLPGPHLQTLWPVVFPGGRARLKLTRERLELPDGDFLDLDWLDGSGGSVKTGAPSSTTDDAPLALIVHGLEGSSDSHYARGWLGAFGRMGWSAVVMHFRNCSGEPNRLARSYHSGETGDLAHVVGELRCRIGAERALFVAGVSLGGNALLKWLGEAGAAAGALVDGAAAVCVPFDLGGCADRMERGFSKVYRARLMRDLHQSVRRKFEGWGERSPIDLSRLEGWRTFREFDEHVTAPLHGFAGAEDYYRRSTSRPHVAHIRVPTLIVQARDDPFMPDGGDVPPCAPPVRCETFASGGHAGFVEGAVPGRARYWLDERIPAFFEAVREQQGRQ